MTDKGLVVALMSADIVVCTGVGKSGKVAALAADLLQTVGCKATFVHPTDMMHGSVNILPRRYMSLVVMFTNSGFTDEISALHCHIRDVARAAKIVYVTSVDIVDDADYMVSYGKVIEDNKTGTIPVLASAVQITAIGEYVNRIADIATPEFLAAGHPKGAIARVYERMTNVQ
jgi:arabinose-5-phosphate isomerase